MDSEVSRAIGLHHWNRQHLWFVIFQGLQGSVATQLRWGGRPCNSQREREFPWESVSEKNWKMIYICQSYDQKSSILFFETQCICVFISKYIPGCMFADTYPVPPYDGSSSQSKITYLFCLVESEERPRVDTAVNQWQCTGDDNVWLYDQLSDCPLRDHRRCTWTTQRVTPRRRRRVHGPPTACRARVPGKPGWLQSGGDVVGLHRLRRRRKRSLLHPGTDRGRPRRPRDGDHPLRTTAWHQDQRHTGSRCVTTKSQLSSSPALRAWDSTD